MFFPFRYFIFISILNQPFEALFRQVVLVCTVFVTNKNVKWCSGDCSTIDRRLISMEFSVFIMWSILVSLNKFSKIAKRCIPSGSISWLPSWKNCMHVSSCTWFWTSLIWLRKRVFFITFLQEITFCITENFTWVYTFESMVRVTINNCEEILSSFCVFECGRDQLMKFLIIDFLKIDVLIVVFFILLILELVKVSMVFVDLKDVLVLLSFLFPFLSLQFSSVFDFHLMISIYYVQCFNLIEFLMNMTDIFWYYWFTIYWLH